MQYLAGALRVACFTAHRQLKRLREEGKLPKGGLEAGKLHGLTKEDLKGEPLKIYKPSDEDMKKIEYVSATNYCLCCLAFQGDTKNSAHSPVSRKVHMLAASMSWGCKATQDPAQRVSRQFCLHLQC